MKNLASDANQKSIEDAYDKMHESQAPTGEIVEVKENIDDLTDIF